jgi:hypothetical protein
MAVRAAAANVAAGVGERTGLPAGDALDLYRELTSDTSWDAAYTAWLARHGGSPPRGMSPPEMCRQIETHKLSILKSTARTELLRMIGREADAQLIDELKELLTEGASAAAEGAKGAFSTLSRGAAAFGRGVTRAAAGVTDAAGAAAAATAAAFDNRRFNEQATAPTIDGHWKNKKFFRKKAGVVRGGKGQYLEKEYVRLIHSINPNALTPRAKQILRFFEVQLQHEALAMEAQALAAAAEAAAAGETPDPNGAGAGGGTRKKLRRNRRATRRHRRNSRAGTRRNRK